MVIRALVVVLWRLSAGLGDGRFYPWFPFFFFFSFRTCVVEGPKSFGPWGEFVGIDLEHCDSVFV